MSTLSVTTIQSGNGTTDITVSTGNASSGKIFMPSTGGITVFSNVSVNVFTSTVSGNVGIGVSNAITISSGGNTNFTGNVGLGNTAPATKLQIDGNYGIKSTTLTAGNNHNINCASGNYFIVTCNSSAQNVYFTNAPTGTAYGMIVRFANGAGGNTLSFANSVKWPSALQPTASTNNDIWVFVTDDGGTTWRGNLTMKDSR